MAYFGNKGYIGNKMSVRASQAYDDGEMPLSKWTKQDIINAYPEQYHDALSKLTLKELRDYFLQQSSWHHTGKFYNKTDFYSPYDLDYEDKGTMEDLLETVERHRRWKQERKEEEARKKIEKENFDKLSPEEQQKIYDEWNNKRLEYIQKVLPVARDDKMEFTDYEELNMPPQYNDRQRSYKEGESYNDEQPLYEEYKKYLDSAPSYFDYSKLKTYWLVGKHKPGTEPPYIRPLGLGEHSPYIDDYPRVIKHPELEKQPKPNVFKSPMDLANSIQNQPQKSPKDLADQIK